MQNDCLITTRINYCVCEFSIGKLHTNGVKSSHCATAVDALRKKIPRRIVESHHALWARTVGGRRAREREGVNSAAAAATAVRWGRLSSLMAFSSAKPRLHAKELPVVAACSGGGGGGVSSLPVVEAVASIIDTKRVIRQARA